MRRVFALALLSLLASVPAADARTRMRPCKPGHAHVLASDSVAQVYFTGRYEEEGGWFRPETIVGCVYGRSRVTVVGHDNGGGSGGTAYGWTVRQLAGSYVAVAATGGSQDYGSETDSIAVYNLRTGKTVIDTPTGPPEPSSADLKSSRGYGVIVGAGAPTAVVLKTDGAVAWIAAPPSTRITAALGAYQVYAFDSAGKRMVGAGSDIEPYSLALAGSTVYWTQAGSPHSSALE
jgi:hypothetical protein